MMKKVYPIFQNGVFNNSDSDSVVINTKKVIFHYISGIFDFSHLYFSKKHYAAIPQGLKKNGNKKKLAMSYGKVIVTPLGHSSLWISYKQYSIVVDPVFTTVSFFFKRFTSSIEISHFRTIDLVIYSHNHPDHLCIDTLEKIIKKFPDVVIVAPLGCDIVIKKSFSFYAGQKIITFNWWDSFIIYEDIVLTALPAIHWSQSNFFDRNKSLWASWMIKIKDKHVYIAGDTAYGDHFSLIQSFFPSIDLACLPIAPYEPKDIQIDSHMNVEESYKAFKDLDAHFFMPIHWGVFAYGDEKLKDPIKQIILLMKNKNKLSSLVSTVYNQSFVLL